MTTSVAAQLLEPSQGLRPSVPCTQYLLALELCTASRSATLPPLLCDIIIPLKVQAWEWVLRAHPDRALVAYLLRRIQNGFHIGFHPIHPWKASKQNMQSAYEHPLPVDEYLATECRAGRTLSPLPLQLFSQAKISPFGVIPKCNQPGKWHLILKLSAPGEQTL